LLVGWRRPNGVQLDTECGIGSIRAQLDLEHPTLGRLDGATELHGDRAAAGDPAENGGAHLALEAAAWTVLRAEQLEFHAAGEDPDGADHQRLHLGRGRRRRARLPFRPRNVSLDRQLFQLRGRTVDRTVEPVAVSLRLRRSSFWCRDGR
jgi:hypothetical protein